jgi:hypothetical protein
VFIADSYALKEHKMSGLTYYTMQDDKITLSADWPYSGHTHTTDRKIVRGRNGKLHFADEEPSQTVAEKLQSAEIRARLHQIDQLSIRPIRAGESDRLAVLENEATTLREQLAALTATKAN